MHMPLAEILFLLFVVWAIARLFSRTASSGKSERRVGLPAYPASRSARGPALHAVRGCPDPRCRHQNPGHARFCAQCGRRLATEEVDDSSMWVDS